MERSSVAMACESVPGVRLCKAGARFRIWRQVMTGAACASLLTTLVACSPTRSSDTGLGAPTPAPPSSSPSTGGPTSSNNAAIRTVPVRQWRRMVQAGMVRPGCPITSRAQLRRVDVAYVNFQGDVLRGNLVVNQDTAVSVARIFTSLFEQRFPIASIQGVERFEGDSNASLRANNTAAYNCRRPDQINAPPRKSPHANGRAVDINPLQNPWKDLRCKCWSPSSDFAKRTPQAGKILDGDTVWSLFTAEGWIWQNIDVPDYMHFDTGYPSAPLKDTARTRSLPLLGQS